MTPILTIVWILAALFTLNSLLITLRTHYNAGTTAMWVISAALILYGIFHREVGLFAATGFGRAVLIIVGAGCAAYVGMMVFLGVVGSAGCAKGDERAIIVLGAGLKRGEAGDLLKRRLRAALAVHTRNPAAPIVVSGGQGPREPVPEAAAMRRWLLAQGLPEAAILPEDQSTTTEENLLFSKELLARRGIGPDEPVAVVTNTFHCYRAGYLARRCGYANARLVPASMNATTFLQNYLREVMAVVKTWWLMRKRPG